MDIKPGEITDILKREIKEYDREIDVAETGTVLSIGDGIARVYGLDRAIGAGDDGYAEAPGGVLRGNLVAHGPDMLGRRTDEGDAVILQDLGEAGVLGKEAIAGVDGVCAGYFAGSEKARYVEIAFR